MWKDILVTLLWVFCVDFLHAQGQHGERAYSREIVTRTEGSSHAMSGDLVAAWDLALSDGVHKVEFEHGTISGKRIIRVDGQEIYRVDWMSELVGREHFEVNGIKCAITIEAVCGFAYEYTLYVAGKPLKKFHNNQSKIMKTWITHISGYLYRIVLEKDTLDVWVNGKVVETAGELVDDGTETHFEVNKIHSAFIKASGKQKDGIVHTLYIDDQEVPLDTSEQQQCH